MLSAETSSFLRVLWRLRWLAIAGQAATILFVSAALGLPLQLGPLWVGVAALTAFNVLVGWQVLRSARGSHGMAFAHLMTDVVVLAWMVAWSGGVTNPFGMLFLVIIALAAVGLPERWALSTAVACVIGYGAAAALGQPIPIVGEAYALHLWGMAGSFLITGGVVLFFVTRVAEDLRRGERELSSLRERFARNEGIVALATHAASMAHELNTPLATMTLLTDELVEQAPNPAMTEDLTMLRQLLGLCRERVRALAVPSSVDLERVVSQWRLVRPTISLHREGRVPDLLRVDPAIGHLLQALLNNAADAGEELGAHRVDLKLSYADGVLQGEVRDYGRGFNPDQPLLPVSLFRSSKREGLGVGLVLSHATVEQLGGELTMTSAEGGGTLMRFALPLPLAANFPEAADSNPTNALDDADELDLDDERG